MHNPHADTMFDHRTPHSEVVVWPPRPLPVAGLDHMCDPERLSRLRHDLSNPLSALLAEVQLLLLDEPRVDAETLTSLREIEALAIRMRTMLREP